MTAPLLEFRCPTCRKLLFKGTLLVSTVEIKCDRCGKISTIRELNNDLFDPTSFGILVDRDGQIANACVNAQKWLGYTFPELVSMRASKISSVYSDEFVKELTAPGAQQLRYEHKKDDTVCVTKTGTEQAFVAQSMPLETNGQPYIFTIFHSVPQA